MQPSERRVAIAADGVSLAADLVMPADSRGLVIFAHGSGSSRRSPRNRLVASALQQGGFGTLLLDLLTEREEAVDAETGELRFDIGLLAERLTAAIDWTTMTDSTPNLASTGLPVGLFGASTGAAAAIVAAADRPDIVRAVVSRGGRPDLAKAALPALAAPTLLIVGGADLQVLELNRQALGLLRGEKRLDIIDGATHLFEEPGALERVAALAGDWFARHMAASSDSRPVAV